MIPKCAWCNKQSDDLKEITVLSTGLPASNRRKISYSVCPEHEHRLRRFYDRVRRYAILFVSLMIIGIFGVVMPSVFYNNVWSGYLFIMSFESMGLVLVIFPFCAPETMAMMGVAKSIRIARIMGGAFFAVGAFVFILALLYR
ncbi:MAG: hypothetical protein JW804_00645 [Sedimentisphaerales bacterium]|nr:hypothetical protein [Sedimentisphaerales bacterium]